MTEPVNISAPGRICLFGDHQDYLGLPIIASAIDRYIHVQAAPRSDRLLHLHFDDIPSDKIIDLDERQEVDFEGDFILSALHVVRRYGVVIEAGYDVHISGDIPMNAGLSSSSALVVAWIRFLLGVSSNDITVSPAIVAQLAYEAEVIELGSSGGRMDQYAISHGGMIYLETDQDYALERMKEDLPTVIIGESGVPKDTTGDLHRLKDRALESIAEVQEHFPSFDIKTARVVDAQQYIESVSESLRDYLHAALLNHDITLRAKAELERADRDFTKIGALMTEHHAVLRDMLHITVPTIDSMIDAAMDAGAMGAKIVGSGGGGCIVALCEPQAAQRIIDAMLEAGAKDAYMVKVSKRIE